MYCHQCGNPILGSKFAYGDMNTAFHPACKKQLDQQNKHVQPMSTYYNYDKQKTA